VVLDTSPPLLVVLGPPGEEWGGSVVGVAASEELASWQASLYDAQGHAVQTGVVADEGAQLFLLLVPGLAAAGGRGRLEVRVRDLAGNESVASREVVLGPDPFWVLPETSARFASLAWTSRRYEAHTGTTHAPPPWSPPVPTRERQAYRVGEVVYLRVRVSEPSTGVPVDPSGVTLESLVLREDPDVRSEGNAFTRSQEGLYYLPVDTTGLPAGTYDWAALLVDDEAGGAVAPGYFVLEGAP